MIVKKPLHVLFVFSICLILAACATSSATQTVASPNTPIPTVTIIPPTETLTPTPAAPSGPQAGTQMLYADGSTLIYIPAGEFQMGGGGKDNPVHTIKLDSYWIQRTEVTRRMYSICLAAGKCTQTKDLGVGGFVTDSAYLDYPVVGIDWNQAQSYCAWIDGSLPTEAEWEMAARGPQGNIYPWGNAEPSCDLLNFNSCIGAVNRATNNQSDKSSFGVLDMAGNVREWVNDFYQSDYYKNSPSANPEGPKNSDSRVYRGGGFTSPAEDVTAFDRSFLKPSSFRADLGFRCVVKSPQSYAPYCRAAPVAHQNSVSQPAERCVPITTVINRSCQNFTTVTTGGKLISVEGGTACVICPNTASSPIPDLECPANYESNGSTYCEYKGGPIGDCPTGSVILQNGQCIYQQELGSDCPLGSYFDTGLSACVTASSSDSNCLNGITYINQGGCCRAPLSEDNNPQCRSDEYFDYQYGCIPLPQSDGIHSCATAQLPSCFP